MNYCSNEIALERSHNVAKNMNTVAHSYEHALCVLTDILAIAEDAKLPENDKFILSMAVLWHDIGLDYVEKSSNHPHESVERLRQEFSADEFHLRPEDQSVIEFLIRFHNNSEPARKETADNHLLALLEMLIDADRLELLGERGYARAVESVGAKNCPDYWSENPKGDTYGLTGAQFDERFDKWYCGELPYAIEPTLIGQLNFQISVAELLVTRYAKQKGNLGVAYLIAKRDAILPKG